VKTEKDFEELLGLFNRHKVRYCIIGSYAVAFYAKPRYTKDIDILIEPSAANGRRIIKALKDFGFDSLALSEGDFRTKKRIIQLGYEPLRIDLMTSVEGRSFRRIWKNRTAGAYGAIKANIIGLEDLMALKKRSERLQDKMDLEALSDARNAHRKSR
jgi:predicted nucleotidyltransferase